MQQSRWGTLSGAGRLRVAALRLVSFSQLTRVDQDISEPTSCWQVAYVHEAPHATLTNRCRKNNKFKEHHPSLDIWAKCPE
eukprot:155138-Chlamydomonas_euryale.AAC.6